MEFRVLGSLEVWDGPRQIEIGGTKRRALLALLVLHANEVVGKDNLIDDLWGENAPRTAAASLHNHISRLRKALGPDRLVTRAWGYVLRVEPDEVDLHRFEHWVAEAEAMPARERSAKLGDALALFRGPVLADLAYEPALAKDIGRLEESRLAALEARLDADLELGRSADLVPELEALIAEHPLRERLRGQLILALYRGGRQAEALEVYRETRRLLADELGLEPSPALRELERAILRQDPELAALAPPPKPIVGEAAGRWTWPRSPLVIVPALLLLAGGGAAVAVVSTRDGARREPGVTRAAGDTVTVLRETLRSTSTVQRPATTGGKPRAVGRGRRPSTSSRSHRRLVTAVRHAPTVHHFPKHTAERYARPRPARPRKPSLPARVRHSKPPAKPKVYRLADDFTDPAFNSGLWNVASHGNGVQVAEQTGRLEFSIAPAVTYDPAVNAVDQHYGTNCYLTGNFDAEVDYQLLTWPKNDGVLVSFGVYLAPPRGVFWSISREGKTADSTSEGYLARIDVRGQWTPTADTSGALRLRRVGDTLSTYYRRGRRWTRLYAEYAPGPASLVLMLAAHPGEFGNAAASAAFDNFQASAVSVSCPSGIPLPPRSR